MRIIAISVFLLSAIGARAADSCHDLSTDEQTRLARYVTKKYQVPEKANIQIREQSVVNDLSYRKLLFVGQGALGKIELRLYVSPDLRFLSTDILDSRVDPGLEERQSAQSMMSKLQEGEFASRGSPNAPVTLVVFSDFQCPFCRRMQQMLSAEPLLSPSGGVRLIFRHFPLAQHDWARQAAEAVACAQFQSGQAFWQLHDSVFENQDRITRDSLTDKVYDFASRVPGLDMLQLRACIERQMSLGIVTRDKELGLKAGVSATPTLFLDGRPLPAVHDDAELHQILAEALQHVKANRSDTATANKASTIQ